MPQPRNNRSEFNTIPVTFDSPNLLASNNNLNARVKLVDDPN